MCVFGLIVLCVLCVSSVCVGSCGCSLLCLVCSSFFANLFVGFCRLYRVVLAVRLVGWLVGRLVGWSVDRLVGWLVCLVVDVCVCPCVLLVG